MHYYSKIHGARHRPKRTFNGMFESRRLLCIRWSRRSTRTDSSTGNPGRPARSSFGSRERSCQTWT